MSENNAVRWEEDMANPLRKTMVYLGLAEEDQDYEQMPVQEHQPAPQAAPRAPVTPLRKAASIRNSAVHDMNEILTVHPRQYRDAKVVAESFRDGIPVIINLSDMTDGDARRMIDFASGLSQGLHGRIERVTAKVFLLSPAHIAVSGESEQSEDTDSVFDA